MIALIIIFFWNLTGFVFYAGIQLNATMFTPDYQLLKPADIKKLWGFNTVGCWITAIFFNLLCPVWSIIYWFSKLIKFLFTL